MESPVPKQPQEIELDTGQPCSPHASKNLGQIDNINVNTSSFGASKESKNSAGWEDDTRLRVWTATDSIEEVLQRLSAKLDAELQEVDMETDSILSTYIEELQKQNFYFSETYVELGKK